MSCGVLCRKCGKRKENDNCNNESSADSKRRFEQHHHHEHHHDHHQQHQRHRQNQVPVGKCARSRTSSEDKEEEKDGKGNSKSLRRERSDLCVDIADRIDGTMAMSMAQGVDVEQQRKWMRMRKSSISSPLSSQDIPADVSEERNDNHRVDGVSADANRRGHRFRRTRDTAHANDKKERTMSLEGYLPC